MALVDFMTEPDKAQSWERRKEAVVAKLARATRTEAALVIADKGYNLRDMLRAAATSQASVDSTNRQENLVAGLQARGNLGAGESDLSDRDLAVTRLPTRQIENSNPVPGTVVAKRLTLGKSFNPFCAETIQNPYPAYRRLRTHSPVHRSQILGAWLKQRPAQHDS